MSHFIINTDADYADEFDYPIVSVMTKNERDLILNTFNIWKDGNYDDIYFGTNEFLSFDAQEIYRMIEKAVEITDEEYKYFKRFSTSACVDIISEVEEELMERFGYNSYSEISRLPYSEALEKYPEYFV